MKGIQSNGFLPIIAQAIASMEEVQGEFSSIDEIHLEELSRKTGLSRSKLRRLKNTGFCEKEHGLTGKTKPGILDGYASVQDSLLRSGVSNSSVCMERLKELGYTGGLTTIKRYIEYGGTLKMENMSFDDPDFAFDDVSFRNDESTRKYIDTAISRNIQHTLKNDRFGEYFNQLRELYDKGELTNVINRIVESMNHKFLLDVVQIEFNPHDFGSAKNLLAHEYPAETAFVLYGVDKVTIVERLKTIIDVKEKSDTSVTVTQEHIDKVKKYLFMDDNQNQFKETIAEYTGSSAGASYCCETG